MQVSLLPQKTMQTKELHLVNAVIVSHEKKNLHLHWVCCLLCVLVHIGCFFLVERCIIIIMLWMTWPITSKTNPQNKKKATGWWGDKWQLSWWRWNGWQSCRDRRQQLFFHSLSHWEPTMGTVLIISAALLHYCIQTGYDFRVSACDRLF